MGKLGAKATIRVAKSETVTNEEGDREPIVVYDEVEALVKGYLAVHKRDEEMQPGKPWRITHTVTGLLVRDYETRKEAVKVRDALVNSEIDWEFTDDYTEAKTSVTREISEEVKRIEAEVVGGVLATSPPDRIGEAEELLTVKEVVELLGIPQRTVYHYVNTGRIPAMKLGGDLRVFREDAEKVAEEIVEEEAGRDPEAPEGSLDLNDVARWLKHHPEHIRRMIRRDGLPAHKAGRNGKLYFLKDEVMGWLRGQSIT